MYSDPIWIIRRDAVGIPSYNPCGLQESFLLPLMCVVLGFIINT